MLECNRNSNDAVNHDHRELRGDQIGSIGARSLRHNELLFFIYFLFCRVAKGMRDFVWWSFLSFRKVCDRGGADLIRRISTVDRISGKTEIIWSDPVTNGKDRNKVWAASKRGSWRLTRFFRDTWIQPSFHTQRKALSALFYIHKYIHKLTGAHDHLESLWLTEREREYAPPTQRTSNHGWLWRRHNSNL